jgi:hypothetical protein
MNSTSVTSVTSELKRPEWEQKDNNGESSGSSGRFVDLSDGSYPENAEITETPHSFRTGSLLWFVVLILGIALHDLFVFTAVHGGRGVHGIQWILFCVLQASLPVFGLVFFSCGVPKQLKAVIHVLFSTAAIYAIVYVVVGSLHFRDERRNTIVGIASMGLVSSLYLWFMVAKHCVKKDDNTSVATRQKTMVNQNSDSNQPSIEC